MPEGKVNPFDELDNVVLPGPVLTEGPRPSLAERFAANRDQSYFQGTYAGAVQGRYARSLDREIAVKRYESFPQWETPAEGLVALAGQLAPQFTAIENYTPVGLGPKVLAWSGHAMMPAMRARIFAGAIDAAAANAVIDAGIQGIEIGAGTREGFDPVQFAGSVALGSVVGGTAGGISHAIGRQAPEFEAEEPVWRPPFIQTPLDAPASPRPSAARQTALQSEGQATARFETPLQVAATPLEALGERLDTRARIARGLPDRTQPIDPLAGVEKDLRADLRKGAPAKAKKPESLIQFLARSGGMADDGDLRGMDLQKWFGPGGRALRKKDAGGMSLDAAREKAVEAGYLHDTAWDDGVSTSTVDDLLDAISRELGGDPVYSKNDIDLQNRLADRQAYEAQKVALDKALAEVREALTDDLPEPIKRRAVEIAAAEDIDGGDALERAIMESYHADDARPDTTDAGDDIPFGDVADDGGTGLGARDAVAAMGGERSRPGEEGTLSRDGDRARAPGRTPGEGGRQGVIPGAEGIGQGAQAQRRADQPLQAKTAQNVVMDEGLFGDSHLQDEMFSAPRGPSRGVQGRAGGGTTSGPSPQFTRLKEIAEKLATALEAPAVRQNRFQTRVAGGKAAGIYKSPSGVIRLAKPDDFDTLSHELGHHLEVMLGTPVKSLMRRHEAILKPLAYQGANKKKLLEEGFAEYVRLMVTNPAYARNAAPGFDRDFRQLLLQSRADVLDAIDEAAKAWGDWLAQPSQQAVASTIVSVKEPKHFRRTKKSLAKYGLGQTIADKLHGAYAAGFDDLHPIAQAVRELALIHKENTGQLLDLKVDQDPYKLARMSRGAFQSGHSDVMHGVTPYRGTAPASASLRDALTIALGKPNAFSGWDDGLARLFGSYLWSRRALGEWDRYAQGLIPNPPDKLTRGDHQVNVAELEQQYPQFAQAAPMVHEFAQALWQKKRDAGLITDKQYQAGLAIVDYVPGLRVFDQAGDTKGAQAKRGGEAKSGFAKRFQGSRRDVVNPLESLMADAYQTAMWISRNDVVKTLDRLARKAGPGGGAIAERIPSHEIKGTRVDPLEAVESAAREAGLNTIDATLLRDAVEASIGDAQATIFRPAIINEKGEPIAFYRDGGELQAVRLADGEFGRSMYSALTMMSRDESNVFINMLAPAAQVARLGITAEPSFIIANFIRDQAMASIFYGQPLKRFADTVQGMGQEVFNREAARAYARAGGIMGGANVSSLGDARVQRDLNALKAKGWAVQRVTSWKGFLEATELSETGMRLGLFKTFFEQAKKRGLDDYEAQVEAAFKARDHIDFNRHGLQMTGLSRIIPFLNAALQGTDKTTRQMIAPLFREAATAAEARAKADAAKAWARLGVATIATMGLAALMSQHEDWLDISDQTRATHWVIKWGDKWIAVPKPFELAVVLNLGEAAWNAIALKDPQWADRYLSGLTYAWMPPNVLEGNPAIATAIELSTGVNLKTGSDLVPDELKGLEPWLQYTGRTSEISKMLGSAINQSPAIIDHVITNFTTSYGQGLLALYDWAGSDKPAPGWDDLPITRRFIKDASRGASSMRAFWDLVSQRTGSLESARKSWQGMIDGGDAASAADYFASQDEMTRTWIAAGSVDAEVRRLHPLLRSRLAVSAINDLRREMSSGEVTTADGKIAVDRTVRGAADDILSGLAMAEAKNALILVGEDTRKLLPLETWHKELKAADPGLYQALADRYAGAKVRPFASMLEYWPDLAQRLAREGSEAEVRDLRALAKAAGTELNGRKIKPEGRAAVPAAGEE